MAVINNSLEHFETFLEVNKDILNDNKNEIQKVKHEYNIIQIFQLKSQQSYIYHLMYVWFFITVCFYGNFSALNKNLVFYYCLFLW